MCDEGVIMVTSGFNGDWADYRWQDGCNGMTGGFVTANCGGNSRTFFTSSIPVSNFRTMVLRFRQMFIRRSSRNTLNGSESINAMEKLIRFFPG